MVPLIIKINTAAVMASFFCWSLFAKVQPFPFIKRGLDKKVAEAIVVPTNAATNILPPGTWGIEGINPLTISRGRGCTKNSENKKDPPIIDTKITSIFSKKVYLPTSSKL